MRKLSEFIGKPLFTRAGECAGTVKNALLAKNLKTVRAFEYFDDQEDEHTLPVGSVISAEDALMVRSLAEKGYKDAVSAPFGITVYSETGETLGNVCDFLLGENEVKALLLTGEREVPAERIASVQDALIADLSSPLPLRPKRNAPPKTKRAPAQRAAERAAERAEAPRPKAGSTLLTGKRVPENICDARGNVIVKKDCVITADILKRAMAHNKLFELTLCVLSSENAAAR